MHPSRSSGARRSRRRCFALRALAVAATAAIGWVLGRTQPLVDDRNLIDILRSPALGGVAGVVAAVIGGATALAIARRDRQQRERAERKARWWARARWALDLLMADHLERRLVGYRVLQALAVSEWSSEHETGLVESAVENAAVGFEQRVDDAMSNE